MRSFPSINREGRFLLQKAAFILFPVSKSEHSSPWGANRALRRPLSFRETQWPLPCIACQISVWSPDPPPQILRNPCPGLGLPSRPLDDAARDSIERQLREHLAAQGRDPIRRLRWLLLQIQASPGLTIDDAAGMLHLSVRTLQRRLTGQGLDFRSLLGDSRCAGVRIGKCLCRRHG